VSTNIAGAMVKDGPEVMAYSAAVVCYRRALSEADVNSTTTTAGFGSELVGFFLASSMNVFNMLD